VRVCVRACVCVCVRVCVCGRERVCVGEREFVCVVGYTSESKEKFADLHKETYQFVKRVFLGNTSKVTYKH